MISDDLIGDLGYQVFLWALYALLGLMSGGVLFTYLFQRIQQAGRLHKALINSVVLLPNIVFLVLFSSILGFIVYTLQDLLGLGIFLSPEHISSAIAVIGLGFVFAATLADKIQENETARPSGYQSRILRLIGLGGINRELVARYDLEVLEATLEVMKALAVVHLIGAQNITMILMNPYYFFQNSVNLQFIFEFPLFYRIGIPLILALLYGFPIYAVVGQVKRLRRERIEAAVTSAATLPLQSSLARREVR